MSDRPTILYVEPEKLIREHIGEGLELEGHRVLLAHHAREGLDILEQATNKIDLILSNISMPNMNGYDFFTAVRANKNWSDIAFILLTGRAARTDVRLGLSLGVTDYLTLPTTMEDVLNAVDIAIKRQRRLYGKHVGFLETRLAIEPSAIFNHKPTLFLSYAREDRIPVSEIY